MTHFCSPLPTLAFAATLLTAGAGAHAAAWDEAVSQHPAMVPAQVLPAVTSRVYLIGHPASPTTRGNPLNHRDHPAVAIARRARDGADLVDPNTFLVQPPASTQWTMGPDVAAPAVALLGR